MENQTSSKNIIINNGLIYGIALIIPSVITFALGMHLEPTVGYINFAIIALALIIFPIVGISQFKKQNDGLLDWGKGVKIGIGIVLIGTLLNVIYLYIFTTFIEPDFYTQVAEITRNGLEDAGLTEEQIETQMNIQSKFQGTPLGYGVSILFFIFLAFVVSAIVAAIMKKTEEDQY